MLINLRNALMAGKRLPYDAELEYLESTGTQYIDTGVVPTNTTGCFIRCTFCADNSTEVTDGCAHAFDFENCVDVRKLLPENTVQFLTSKEVTSDLIEKLIENKLDLDIYYKQLNKDNIELLHSKGIKVNCWTCDDKEDAENLVSYGVDFITTNILE